MRKYNYLQAIYLSFYSRKLYKDVLFNWGANVVLYLVIVLAISWAILVAKFQPRINIAFQHFITKFSSQVPVVDIKNGTASTPENRPYLIHDPDTNVVHGIIDTSGQYKTLEDVPASVDVLVTDHKIFYKKDENSVRIHKFPSTLNYTFEPNDVKNKLISFVKWGWILLYPILLIFSLIYRLVQALIYAMIGKIFGALSANSIRYVNVLKLSIVAVTPAIVIATILDFCRISFSYEWLFYFILSMAYLLFALGANKKT